MSTTEHIKSLLEDYFSAVDAGPQSDPQKLRRAIEALEKVSRNPDPELPGRLKHYLESRSYRKAYVELGGVR